MFCFICHPFQIGWPSSLTTVFKFASFTTVNIDSASPECSVKGLGYVQKWAFVELVPVFAGLVLIVAYMGKVGIAYMKWRRTPPERRKPLKGKGYATMTNLYLGGLNLMYIFLVQKALEVRKVRCADAAHPPRVMPPRASMSPPPPPSHTLIFGMPCYPFFL